MINTFESFYIPFKSVSILLGCTECTWFLFYHYIGFLLSLCLGVKYPIGIFRPKGLSTCSKLF